MMTPQADHPVQERVLPARSESSAAARQIVLEACPPELGPAGTAHAELVTSELVANAVEHGSGDEVVLLVRPVGDAAIEITVRNRTDGDLPPRPWAMPGPDARRGRGLPVVESIARVVDAGRVDDALEVRALVVA